MWNHSRGPGPSNRRETEAYNPDEATRTRAAIQHVARKTYEQNKRQEIQQKDDSVFQQSGYGDSDSDEDSGGIRILLPQSQQLTHEEVFTPPAVLKQKQDKEEAARRAAEQQRQNAPFRTFPIGGAPFNPYAPREDDASSEISSNWSVNGSQVSRQSNRRKRSRSSSRRRRDDSRGSRRRHRDESRDSKDSRRSSRDRDHHRKRRRRSSSSGESRNSRASKNSRDSRDSRRRDHRQDRQREADSEAPMSMVIQNTRRENKWEFLPENQNPYDLSYRVLVTAKKLDPDNNMMLTPKKEIAQMRLGVRYILGMEHDQDLFRKLYSGELHAQERKLIDQKKTFVKQLEDVAKHAPMETYFRRIVPKDGYWKVLQNRDILNEVRESGDVTDPRYQSDEMFGELEKLKKAIKDNSLDVESLIKFIDLQEEQNRLNRGSFASRRPQDIAEEHIHRILDAIKVNKRESILPVMLCEQMRKAEHSKEAILKKYQEATHNHPHDPMVWLSYLDYVQYDSNVYTVALMKTVFTNCIRKTNLLVSGTLMSHAHLSKDLPAFREFHLSVYLRYLKWCISNGCGPHAIALVQASMEWNQGLPKNLRSDEQRQKMINEYWETCLPRIGDVGGLGISEMQKTSWKEDSALEMEREELQEFLRATMDTQYLLRDQDQCQQRNWVDFERKMQEIDARPKRHKFQDFDEFNEAAEQIDTLEIFDPIYKDDLEPYIAHSSIDVMDWTQPMLELLGVKFFHSPGCFTTTEQVIAEFSHKNIFEGAALPNFPSVPNYNEKTCETMGLRIMAFLLGQRHEEKKTDKEHIDDQMMKYLLAGIETHAQRMEKDPKFIYYQLKPKHLKSLISSFAKSTEVYVNVYERLRHAQALFAALKCTVWLERAVAEQTELRRLTELAKKNVETEKSAVLAEHALMPSDVENLGKYRNSLWTYITTVTQSLEGPQKKDLNDPTISYPTVQLLLYSKILLARQYVASDTVAKTIRKLLAKDIMQEDDELIEGLDAKGLLYLQLKEVLTDWTEMISKRDAKEESECIPEFPRVGALCQALLWAVEFVFLNQNKEPRKTINLVAQSLLEQFKVYEKNKKDFNRTEIQKYRDRVDIQFLFDTLIALFSHKNYRTAHYENYQNIVVRASESFTCETKYMLKLAELFSTSRFQWMKIRGRIADANRALSQKSRFQYDVQNERRLLMNTLTGMFVAMRISGRGSNGRFVFENWRQEAMTLRDSAVWRMVMKVAGGIGTKAVEETFIRAHAQCPWSFNLLIDYVEQIPEKLIPMLDLHLDTEGLLHYFYLDSPENLTTFYEIGAQAAAEQRRMMEIGDEDEAEDSRRRRHGSQNPEDVKPVVQEIQRALEHQNDVEMREEPEDQNPEARRRQEAPEDQDDFRRRQEAQNQHPEDLEPRRRQEDPESREEEEEEDVKPDVEKLQREMGDQNPSSGRQEAPEGQEDSGRRHEAPEANEDFRRHREAPEGREDFRRRPEDQDDFRRRPEDQQGFRRPQEAPEGREDFRRRPEEQEDFRRRPAAPEGQDEVRRRPEDQQDFRRRPEDQQDFRRRPEEQEDFRRRPAAPEGQDEVRRRPEDQQDFRRRPEDQQGFRRRPAGIPEDFSRRQAAPDGQEDSRRRQEEGHQNPEGEEDVKPNEQELLNKLALNKEHHLENRRLQAEKRGIQNPDDSRRRPDDHEGSRRRPEAPEDQNEVRRHPEAPEGQEDSRRRPEDQQNFRRRPAGIPEDFSRRQAARDRQEDSRRRQEHQNPEAEDVKPNEQELLDKLAKNKEHHLENRRLQAEKRGIQNQEQRPQNPQNPGDSRRRPDDDEGSRRRPEAPEGQDDSRRRPEAPPPPQRHLNPQESLFEKIQLQRRRQSQEHAAQNPQGSEEEDVKPADPTALLNPQNPQNELREPKDEPM